jgi:hypothetical protein
MNAIRQKDGLALAMSRLAGRRRGLAEAVGIN